MTRKDGGAHPVFPFSQQSGVPFIFLNYLKTTLRFLFKQKIYSTINILGLFSLTAFIAE